ncbi:NAD(P)/FAD-dependent oxidoreductase [Actinocorallia sp. A-T 12471]|uniref:flavin-containing monooxygenase n=1 Tax=Actinocorallia sp. A-T 12471 TaxID=3089813 RepID=UPI0029CB8D78|nr:NAD(P)/FAD-dependent oxidoreductase [Actinocorallia sp. A-T 12471]MDX6739413.1 NAD(P)/FAD-dependent oxidoreductase [Actinocorallia sp. A-T 12471]
MEHVRVAIIGAGFGGIGLAIRLRQAGIGPVLVLEKADEIGGTWRDNTYPGAACDVPSHLYSFSFERKADWTRRYSGQAEILDYLRHCADKYGIKPRLNTEVHEAVYQDGRWLLTTSSGTVRADVLVSATGQLNRPLVPDLPGLETFAGKAFHSARWDHDHDLTGRRVAVIGTGASAIQFVPHVAREAAELTVYQRSAPWIITKADRAYTARQHGLFAALPATQDLSRALIYALLESRALGFVTWPKLLKIMERTSLRRLRAEVADPELRRKLTPDYALGCKRILLSDDYYPAIQRPNVELVTDAVKEVRPEGIVSSDGKLRPADTLILGTGFRATEFLAPMRVTGRDGVTLDDVWHGGAHAHLGVTVHGFPNLYLLYGPNTSLGHNSIVYMLESQFAYILGCVRSGRVLEVRAEAHSRFAASMRELSKRSVWTSGCRSWYLTEDGANTVNWPGYTFAYRRATRRPDPADFRVLPAPRADAVPDAQGAKDLG